MYTSMRRNLWQAHLKNHTRKQVIAKFASLNEKSITCNKVKMKMEVACHRLCAHACRLCMLGSSQLFRAQLDRVALKLLDPEKDKKFCFQSDYLNKRNDDQLIMQTEKAKMSSGIDYFVSKEGCDMILIRLDTLHKWARSRKIGK